MLTGHKKDTWIAVDVALGKKIQTLSMEGTRKVCPSNAENVIYIGRTGMCRCWNILLSSNTSYYIQKTGKASPLQTINTTII